MTSAPQPADATRPSRSPDAALLRRVRWRLVLWSGGTTLVVLIVLGSALYATLANYLAADRARAGPDPVRRRSAKRCRDARRFPPERVPLGFSVGRPVVGNVRVPRPAATMRSSPRPRSRGSPRACPIAMGSPPRAPEARDLRELSLEGVPVRILSEQAKTRFGFSYVVQVVQDRSGEQRLLNAVLFVLIGGGAHRADRGDRSRGRSTPTARSYRSASRSGASASSPPTRPTSCARHWPSSGAASTTSSAIAMSPSVPWATPCTTSVTRRST